MCGYSKYIHIFAEIIFWDMGNAALIEKSEVTLVYREWMKASHHLNSGNRWFLRFMFFDMDLCNTANAGISNVLNHVKCCVYIVVVGNTRIVRANTTKNKVKSYVQFDKLENITTFAVENN